ncbi:hypothetical protein JCM10207_000256 [Rhodosporidiobolus poonsookiae]
MSTAHSRPPSATPPRVRKRSKPLTTSSSRSSRTSSATRKRTKPDDRWHTDDDTSDAETEPWDDPPRPLPQKRTARPPPPRAASSFFSFRRWCGRAALATLVHLAPFLPYVFLFTSLYLGIPLLRSYLSTFLPSLPLPTFLLAPLTRLATLPLPLPYLSHLRPLAVLPCTSLGVLCPPGYRSKRDSEFQLLSAGAARTATLRAQHAVDIFDHLVKLGDPEESVGLSLHPVECWELATAVRYTSALEDREHISQELSGLGDLSREVKENVIGINAQGMNAMVWIVHEFTRLEELLTRALSSSKPLSASDQAAYTALLDALFTRINTSLTDLLLALDKALPSATRASDSARRIYGALTAERSSKEGEWERLDWPTKLLDAVGAEGGKAKQLRRDLDLTRASAGAVIGVWEALEGTREALIGYSKHVGHFKAGVVGFHLSGHGLSVADEVASLRTVMSEMRGTLEQARSRNVRAGGAGRRGRRGEIGG